MTESQPSPFRGIEDIFQKGLGLFNNGVDQLSSAISTADTSVRKVDGSLTGAVAGLPPAGNPQLIPQDGQVVGQVMQLARQGQQAAQETGIQSPRAAESFQQLMRLIFNPSMARTDALQDLLPSPAQALQMGMRDLRGSVALVRLANGTGTPDDLVAVVGFAESLVGRVGALSTPAEVVTPAAVASNAAPPVPAPAAGPAGEKKPRKRRGPRNEEEAVPLSASGRKLSPYNIFVRDFRASNPGVSMAEVGRAWQVRKQASGVVSKPRRPRKSKNAADPASLAFAQAVAEEVNDQGLRQAVADFGEGKMTEDQYQEKLGEVTEARGLDFDQLMNRAVERMNVPATT